MKKQTEIKPSDLVGFDKIQNDILRFSIEAKNLRHPEDYLFYYDTLWFPHRKPTVNETLNDKFN
jgi:hypothetical protein